MSGADHPLAALRDRAREPLRRFITLRWVPLTAALLSLVLSLTAIWISTQQPDVTLVLPDNIRVAQGRWLGAGFVYLQPTFVSTGNNERIEVVRDMTLRVQTPRGQTHEMAWTEQVRLVGGASSDGLSYEYVADAGPLLVSPRTAASPVCLFMAPTGFFFEPGQYTFTLTADRVVAGARLEATFDVTLSAEHMAIIDPPESRRFVAIPISPAR
jgi:hypothetical protein